MKAFMNVIPTLVLIVAPSLAGSQRVPSDRMLLSDAGDRVRVDSPEDILSTPARLHIEGLPIIEALTRLQERSGIPVAYSPTLLPAERTVSCQCERATVGAALEMILDGIAFEFVVAADQLVVRKKSAPRALFADLDMDAGWYPELGGTEAERDPGIAPPPQTQGTLTGQVVTATGARPLPNVQISIASLNLATLTTQQGRFLLQTVPVGQHEVTVERIGYLTVTRTVEVNEGEVAELNVTLEERAISMEGLVVTGVAGETPQSQVPFTVESVAASEMQRVAQPSVGSMLQGRVPGVKVVQGSGQAGSEPSFQFRGPTSISGSQEPLIVIDGIITQGGIADLNTEDIESMEVVKGAAAAALYGSRAQAGVLQVTTKTGAGITRGENQVTLRTTFETHNIERYLGVNGGNPWRTDGTNFLDVDGNAVQLPAEGRQLAFDDGADGNQSLRTFADGAYPGETFDPQRQFLNPGNRIKTNVSARGNASGTQYFVSGAYEREEGVITLLDPMEQTQARLNLTQPFGNDFRLKVTTYISDRTRHVTEEGGGFVEGAGRQGNFIRAITFLTPKADLLRPDPDEPGGISAIGEPIDVGNVSENPVNRLINTTNEEDRLRFMGSADGSYTPTSWLTISGNVSFDRVDQDRLRYQRPGLTNLFGDPPTVGSILQEGIRREELNASLTLASNRTFGDLTMRNRFRWLTERQKDDRTIVSGSDLAVDQTPRLGIVRGTPEIDSRKQTVRSEGFFLINQFSYKDRYIGDVLVRRDGSSLFGEDERWQTYGRLSAAWRISQEPWFDVGWLTELKPRYSIGTSGGRPSFAAQYETFAIDRGNVVPTTLGNDQLKPELATEQEFGVDAIIAQRLQVSVNYVDTKVEDQLLLVPLPSKQGFESQWQNAGTLESNTWEVSMEAAIIDQSDVRWTARLSADRTQNTITELNRPAFEITNPGLSRSRMLVKEGETLGSFYGFKFLSKCDQFVSQMPCDQFDVNDMGHLVWVGQGNTWRDGVAKDLWGTTGVVNGQSFRWGYPIEPSTENPLSFTKLGESQPDLNVSLNQNLQWGNFGATVLLDSEWGAQVYNFSQQWQCRDWHCDLADMRNVPDGEKKPIIYFGALQAGNGANDFFTEDSDYIKLREVSVRYTVPQNRMPGILSGVAQATINVTGRNLKTWTDYRGFDPEVGTNSFGGSAVVGRVDEWSIPNFRSFGIDLELVF